MSLLGIRHVALAINKMDLVDYSEKRFREIEAQYRAFAKQIGLADITCIPVSALKGDNIARRQLDTRRGIAAPTLMGWLETVELDETRLQRCRSGCPCSGSTVRTWISAASPARSRAAA